MIDIFEETPLSITQACQLLPEGSKGKKPSFVTVYRWILSGVKTPDGQLVKLEAVRLGGKWLTSREALQRFMDRLTPAAEAAPLPIRSPSKQKRADERVGKALDTKGY
jgi:hypothetical protein